MGLRSGLLAGHCMTSTSSPAEKLSVFRAAWGVALSSTNTIFFWKFALAQRRRFCAKCQCWLTVPLATTGSDLPDAWKAPHTKREGLTFQSVSWRQQPTSLTNTSTNSGTTIKVVKAEPGHQISFETSADGSSSSACVPIRSVGGCGDHESVWCISLDVLGDTQLLPKVFGPCGQKHDTQFIWSALPWFSTMRETCFSSWFGSGRGLPLVIPNQCPGGLDSSSGLPNTTENFGDDAVWHFCVPRYRPLRQPTTRQPNNEFKNFRWEIGWHNFHVVLKLQLMHSDSTRLNVFDKNVTYSLWSN